jgi:hypothetical protein
MDHKNINNDTHDNISDKKTLDSSGIHQEEITQEAFFPENKAPDNIQKNKQQRSILVFLLTIALFIFLGILIFSYIYNLAGLRDFTKEYYAHNNASYQKPEIEHLKPFIDTNAHSNISDNDLNASKHVQNLKSEPQGNDVKTLINSQDDTSVSPEPNDFIQNQNNQTQENYQTEITLLHDNFKKVSNLLLTLNKKLAYGDPYLEILIDLKTQLNNQKIDTPTLTEYASGGFPTDMIIVTDALKVLKKMSLIASQQNSPNAFTNIINRFIVITPQSNTQGLSGIFHKMSKALGNGDYDTVSDLINHLSPKKQKAFNELQILISDKKAIYYELKKLNNAIIDTIFELSHYNNTDA